MAGSPALLHLSSSSIILRFVCLSLPRLRPQVVLLQLSRTTSSGPAGGPQRLDRAFLAMWEDEDGEGIRMAPLGPIERQSPQELGAAPPGTRALSSQSPVAYVTNATLTLQTCVCVCVCVCV